MIYRKLDPNGDYTFGGNSNDFYADTEAVGQAIYTTLQLWQGEWWEDSSAGIPFLEHIIGPSGTPAHLRGADMLVQDAITGVENVTGIESFSSSFRNRKYTVSCTAKSAFGDVVVKGVTFG